MGQITEKTIDIDSILKNKMGAKAKWVPRPLVAWLKRIAHQDQVNAFLWESRDKVGTPWLEACVDYLQMTLEVEGKENLPDPSDGRLYTFVSNHPLGGEDGVALGALIGRHYDSRFRYLVNDLLMYLPGLAPLCIPINKTGKASRNFPAMVEAGFQSDNHMLMFPAGLCSRRHNGIIRDIPWKKTLTSYPFISEARTLASSIDWPTSPTAFYPSIWPCYIWSTRCTKTWARPSVLPLENPFPGRPLTRAKPRWNGQNMCKTSSITYKTL